MHARMCAISMLQSKYPLLASQEVPRNQRRVLSAEEGLLEPERWVCLNASVQRSAVVASAAGRCAAGTQVPEPTFHSPAAADTAGAADTEANAVVGFGVGGCWEPAATTEQEGGEDPVTSPAVSAPRTEALLTTRPVGLVAASPRMLAPKADTPRAVVASQSRLIIPQPDASPTYIESLAAARRVWDGVPYEELPPLTRPLTILKGLSSRTLLPAPAKAAIAASAVGVDASCGYTAELSGLPAPFHESSREHIPRLLPAPTTEHGRHPDHLDGLESSPTAAMVDSPSPSKDMSTAALGSHLSSASSISGGVSVCQEDLGSEDQTEEVSSEEVSYVDIDEVVPGSEDLTDEASVSQDVCEGELSEGSSSDEETSSSEETCVDPDEEVSCSEDLTGEASVSADGGCEDEWSEGSTNGATSGCVDPDEEVWGSEDLTEAGAGWLRPSEDALDQGSVPGDLCEADSSGLAAAPSPLVKAGSTWAGGEYTLLAAADLSAPQWRLAAEPGCCFGGEGFEGQDSGAGGEGFVSVPCIETSSREELDAFLLLHVGRGANPSHDAANAMGWHGNDVGRQSCVARPV